MFFAKKIMQNNRNDTYSDSMMIRTKNKTDLNEKNRDIEKSHSLITPSAIWDFPKAEGKKIKNLHIMARRNNSLRFGSDSS